MPRLFVAIDLPAAIKDSILRLRVDDLPPARWTRREALHLTLHFIGQVPASQASAYAPALAHVLAPPFELRISGIGQFPTEARPRVIWASIENSPALRALHGSVGQALAGANFLPEPRRYHPHITLMRFKKPLRRGTASRWIQAHQDFHCPPFTVTHFTLYESKRRANGNVYYQPLARYPLAALPG